MNEQHASNTPPGAAHLDGRPRTAEEDFLKILQIEPGTRRFEIAGRSFESKRFVIYSTTDQNSCGQ